MIILEYTRACKRGMCPPAAKDYFAFESLFTLDPFWSWSKEDATPLAPVCMMLLNVWWVTREIEASAASIFHLTVDRVAMTASWLLSASKRDPFAVGETRTHGCGCRHVETHPACSFHLCIAYLELLTETFGGDHFKLERENPLFPSRTGRTLLKADVVNAYRAVVAEAGIQTTEIDGTGRVRQRIGGHVCRVL